MRLSVDRHDPGFGPDAFQAKVFFDGAELVGCCITADEEEGRVLVYVLDEAGFPKVKDGGDELATEWRLGGVKIVVAD